MDDLISRQKVLALAKDLVIPYPDGAEYRHRCIDATEIKLLPSEQPDIVEKILAAGKEGKEVRIYIGGRLFSVRELAQ